LAGGRRLEGATMNKLAQWMIWGGVILAVGGISTNVYGCLRRDMRTRITCRSLGYLNGYYEAGTGVDVCVPSPVLLERAQRLSQEP